MSCRGRVVTGFLARRAGAIGAGRASDTLCVLQVLDHLSLLAVRLHLGYSVGVNLLLSEVVGTATS
jgi:hypothetical protein